MDVSVVIPVYRNADSLVELHQRLVRVLANDVPSFEIIFVDDACPESWRLIEGLSQVDARVCAVGLAKNRGQNAAVLAGLSFARGRRAVVLDADLQDPPEEIPRLLEQVSEARPIVFAGRRGKYEAAHRLMTSRAFKYLLHRICGLPADAGIFVALDAAVIPRLLTIYAPRPLLVAMLGCLGLDMTSVPVTRVPRSRGRSAYSSWKRLETGVLAILWALLWKYWVIPNKIERPNHDLAITRFAGARFPTGYHAAHRRA